MQVTWSLEACDTSLSPELPDGIVCFFVLLLEVL